MAAPSQSRSIAGRGVCEIPLPAFQPGSEDLDRLNRETQQRMLRRFEQLSEVPFDPRLSGPLKNTDLRKSRIGGRRIIFTVNQESTTIEVVTIERRGQVYQRI